MPVFSRLPTILLILPPIMGLPVRAMAASAITLAPHHAVYTLALKSSTDQGVLAASGDMTYDVNDACTGLTTSQHLSIHMTNRDGQDIVMLSDYATFESKDGTHLNFHTHQTTDGTVTAELDGTATLDRSGGHGHADYDAPEQRRVALPPGTLLPDAHTIAIIQAGHAGKRFMAVPVFDGTSPDGALDSFVTIEPWRPPHTGQWTALSALAFGRVHVAFFDRGQKTEEPTYETGTRYFDNGVADDIDMNFGDFILNGKLAQFDLKSPAHC